MTLYFLKLTNLHSLSHSMLLSIVFILAPFKYCFNGEGSIYGDDLALFNDLGIRMVTIDSGEFMMGSPTSEKPRMLDEEQVKVLLPVRFDISVCEITQASWTRVMKTSPWEEYDNIVSGDDRPAVCMTWNEAVEFTQKLSEIRKKKFRLPMEAEWEYACRAGSKDKYCFGNDDALLGKYAWWGGLFRSDNGNSKENNSIAKIGTLTPNKWGLFDMHGNVSEWCLDSYKESRNHQDGTDFRKNYGELDIRVVKGGNWQSGAYQCRSAYRQPVFEEKRSELIGFRIVSEHIE